MGHSMGGLLCMAAICNLIATNQKEVLSRIRGLILMATPQTGSQWVPAPLSWVSRDFYALKPHGEFMTRLHETLMNWVILDESHALPNKIVIPTWAVLGASEFWVDKLSAGLQLPDRRKRMIRGSHTAVVKPQSKRSDAYLFVHDCLKTCLDRLGTRHKIPPSSQRGVSEEEAKFGVFLSYSHEDAEWVEQLACRLEDECSFRVWLDKWVLTPGKSWQQGMAIGLNQTTSCAICINKNTSRGWFKQEIERALDLQTKHEDFRVIPVLLPDATEDVIPDFLSLRTWADFRQGKDQEYAFHVLAQGIAGQPIGRWPPTSATSTLDAIDVFERKVIELQRLSQLGLHEEVVIEFERKLLNKWLAK
jgi:hypothetical protein